MKPIDKRTKEYKESVKKYDSVTIAPPIESETKSEATYTKPSDELVKACPWCVFNGHPGTRLVLTHRWQCLDCGKNWKQEALGKPYTLQLEQGIV